MGADGSNLGLKLGSCELRLQPVGSSLQLAGVGSLVSVARLPLLDLSHQLLLLAPQRAVSLLHVLPLGCFSPLGGHLCQ